MEQHSQAGNILPTALIIIGVTGDLSRRKLLPAIAEIAQAGLLPEQFKLIGITRQDISPKDVLEMAKLQPEQKSFLTEHLALHSMHLESLEAYRELATHLDSVASSDTYQRLFYLSVPPQVSRPIIENLRTSGLSQVPHTKLLLEKPFGTDLASAQELANETKQAFAEEDTYRIDHYLAKEMAQNILVFRSQNTLFKKTWNNTFIEKIEIIASEDIGIEGRAQFYEQTGALRDFIQGHALQLAALTLMDLPRPGDWSSIPQKRLEALQALIPPSQATIQHEVIRAQYDGYRDEVGNPHSTTETFVSATFFSSASAWEGVPIQLITGKALAEKTTEIRVHYKKGNEGEANIVTLRLQPREGVEILMWAKQPGYDSQVTKVPLQFTYSHHYEKLPEAYERVLLDAMRSDRSLFTSGDEVLAAWRLLEPIQHFWSLHSDDLKFYKKGASMGDVIL